MDSSEKISDFLSNSALYSKQHLDYGIDDQFELNGTTFNFFCTREQSHQTFKLKLEPAKLIDLSLSNITRLRALQKFDKIESETGHSFMGHYSGTCQYCEKYQVHFLLKYEEIYCREHNRYTLMKGGQIPAPEIKPNAEIFKFLNEEDRENYRKSLICQSQGYGIASFAYLRRIVENEMIILIEKLSTLDRAESKDIAALLITFKDDHVMTKLIEGVNPYLPSSLKVLGNNPLKILYGQLSGGIHEFTDGVCLKKANDMDHLLNFVIKKIKEEGSEFKEAIDAMTALARK